MDVRPQMKEEKKRNKLSKDFWGGLIAGGLIMSLLFTGIYAGRMAYRLFSVQRTDAGTVAGDSIVNGETLSKMKTIEDAIGTY